MCFLPFLIFSWQLHNTSRKVCSVWGVTILKREPKSAQRAKKVSSPLLYSCPPKRIPENNASLTLFCLTWYHHKDLGKLWTSLHLCRHNNIWQNGVITCFKIEFSLNLDSADIAHLGNYVLYPLTGKGKLRCQPSQPNQTWFLSGKAAFPFQFTLLC